MSSHSGHALRAAMVIPWYFPHLGGAETQCAALCSALRHVTGVHVPFLITRRIQASDPSEDVVHGTRVLRLGVPGEGKLREWAFYLAALRRLVAWRGSYAWRENRPYLLWLAAVVAGRLFGKPVILKLSTNGDVDLLFGKRSLLPMALAKWALLRHAARHGHFVALNNEGLTELARAGAIRSRIISNGVDTAIFHMVGADERASLRNRFGCTARDVVLIFCGRFVRSKGVELLLQAHAEFEHRLKERLVVWLVGDSCRKDEDLTDLIETAEASGRVRILPAVFPVAPYLQAADLFVLPSYREGLSNAALEAIACGLPCLLSDIPSHRELADSNPDAKVRMFRAGDVGSLREELAVLLTAICDTPWELRERSRLSGLLQIDRVAERYEELYREAVANG